MIQVLIVTWLQTRRSLTASRQQSAALAQSKWAQATMSGLGKYADAAQEATDLLVEDKGEFVRSNGWKCCRKLCASYKSHEGFLLGDVETQQSLWYG